MRPFPIAFAMLVSPLFAACSIASAPAANALDRYLALVAAHPNLMAQPGDPRRGEIVILTERPRIEAVERGVQRRYAALYDAPTARAASRAGLVMQDPYTLIVRDAVMFPDGSTGLYRRHFTPVALDGGSPGAYCLPILPDGRVVLVREYRHQERAWRIGPPGGFREAGETDVAAAAREAREETGLTVDGLSQLGVLDVDGERVPLFVGRALPNKSRAQPDAGEALGGIVALSGAELYAALLAGSYTAADGQAFRLHGVLGHAYLLWQHWAKNTS